MAQKLDSKKVVTTEEIAHSNTLQIETVLRILVKKGIMTRQEYNDEMKELVKEITKKGTVK